MGHDLTPVHRNLHTKVTFLGLKLEDLILVLALAALMTLLLRTSGASDDSPVQRGRMHTPRRPVRTIYIEPLLTSTPVGS